MLVETILPHKNCLVTPESPAELHERHLRLRIHGSLLSLVHKRSYIHRRTHNRWSGARLNGSVDSGRIHPHHPLIRSIYSAEYIICTSFSIYALYIYPKQFMWRRWESHPRPTYIKYTSNYYAFNFKSSSVTISSNPSYSRT